MLLSYLYFRSGYHRAVTDVSQGGVRCAAINAPTPAPTSSAPIHVGQDCIILYLAHGVRPCGEVCAADVPDVDDIRVVEAGEREGSLPLVHVVDDGDVPA
jgi:hypothetical protein